MSGRRKNEAVANHVRTTFANQDHRSEIWADRRTHTGPFRILFIDVLDLWDRFILRVLA